MFQVIKDYQLFMVVGVLLAIDLAIMTTWQIADPFYRDTKQMEPHVSKYGMSFWILKCLQGMANGVGISVLTEKSLFFFFFFSSIDRHKSPIHHLRTS